MPKVSVIIPIYNAESYLKELFGYINEQSYTDFEVIFVNDGSSDNSQGLLEELCQGKSNFKLINKPNS